MAAKTDRFYFKLDGQNYLFHRDSFSILKLPGKTISASEEKRLSNILKKEEGKARTVGKLTLRTVALNLTNNCNFACDYCFANHGRYDKPGLCMSKEIAIKAIDLLFENISRNHQKRAAIAFFGGEPLLAWDLIKTIVVYAKKNKPKGVRLKFLITTNASLLNKDKIDFFNKNNFSVMVSIDGPRKVNDANRKLPNGEGSYDLIIPQIIEANKSIPLTFRATVTNNNLDLIRIIDHFRQLGAKIITFGLDNNNLKKENYKKIMKSYKKLANKYCQDIMKGNFYEITNFTEILLQIVFKEKKISHCNAGLSYLGVAADGSMYKCPRFTGIPGHKFAHIKNWKEVAERLGAFKSELRENAGARNTHCSQCPFMFLCGGLCHYDLFQKGKDDSDIIEEQCLLRKKIYLEVIKLYAKIPEDVKKDFFLYLTDSFQEQRGGEKS